MKTIKTLNLKFNDRLFRIRVYKTNSPSNYNIFASVFQAGDKTPLVGTTFKDTASNDDIKQWAGRALRWPDMDAFII